MIDTAPFQMVRPFTRIHHNTYGPPTVKHVVAGSIQGKTINVITRTPEPVRITELTGHSSMAFSANSDGSTNGFSQLSAFNGFAVVDFATHKEIGHQES